MDRGKVLNISNLKLTLVSWASRARSADSKESIYSCWVKPRTRLKPTFQGWLVVSIFLDDAWKSLVTVESGKKKPDDIKWLAEGCDANALLDGLLFQTKF